MNRLRVSVSIELLPEERAFAIDEHGAEIREVGQLWFEGGVAVPAVGEEVVWVMVDEKDQTAARMHFFSFRVVRRVFAYYRERQQARCEACLWVRWPHEQEEVCRYAKSGPP